MRRPHCGRECDPGPGGTRTPPASAAGPASTGSCGRPQPPNPTSRAGNPNGSTTALRADVLTALGVLKVATADQLQRLLRLHATSNKALRQTLGDLHLHGLVASDGNTATRHKTWRLEGTAGLEAAGHVLGLPRAEMGGTARGAGRSGAPHAMAANETVVAFVRGGTLRRARWAW
ncbi:replication-relaxation family protein [Kitasatospora aureofaciens]|uniref:replication-relaxation family protein n=1 Tax=Kitasatospora aureofaciens TaxID=1894 RepID=UPI00381E212D